MEILSRVFMAIVGTSYVFLAAKLLESIAYEAADESFFTKFLGITLVLGMLAFGVVCLAAAATSGL